MKNSLRILMLLAVSMPSSRAFFGSDRSSSQLTALTSHEKIHTHSSILHTDQLVQQVHNRKYFLRQKTDIALGSANEASTRRIFSFMTKTRGSVLLALLSKFNFALFLSLFVLFSVPPYSSYAMMNTPSEYSTAALFTSNPKLLDSEAFKNLRREKPQTKAMRDINDLKQLQDDRLDQCADKGEFWEQCFMFGESSNINNDANSGQQDGTRAKKGLGNSEWRNGLDYQLISPTGAIQPGSSRGKTGPPTW